MDGQIEAGHRRTQSSPDPAAMRSLIAACLLMTAPAAFAGQRRDSSDLGFSIEIPNGKALPPGLPRYRGKAGVAMAWVDPKQPDRADVEIDRNTGIPTNDMSAWGDTAESQARGFSKTWKGSPVKKRRLSNDLEVFYFQREDTFIVFFSTNNSVYAAYASIAMGNKETSVLNVLSTIRSPLHPPPALS